MIHDTISILLLAYSRGVSILNYNKVVRMYNTIYAYIYMITAPKVLQYVVRTLESCVPCQRTCASALDLSFSAHNFTIHKDKIRTYSKIYTT